jgi:hypothetical protein
MKDANKIHRKIIAALGKRDGAKAFELARISAERSMHGFLKLMQSETA